MRSPTPDTLNLSSSANNSHILVTESRPEPVLRYHIPTDTAWAPRSELYLPKCTKSTAPPTATKTRKRTRDRDRRSYRRRCTCFRRPRARVRRRG
uniref:Uncharacterized protein n=1 Tax=Arundo donax TaxID=35708 RepID=A0A0A9GWX8_ARUDO